MLKVKWLCFPLVCASLALAQPLAARQPQAGGQDQAIGQAEAAGAPDEPEARLILRRMAEFLAQAQEYSVTIHASYDVVQDTGAKVEFSERRLVTLSRPDRLRVEVNESDGKQDLVVFDGKALTIFDATANAYGQIDIPGGVDEAVHHFIQDLGARLPLAMLLVSTLPAELDRRVLSAAYVERNMLTDIPTDHVLARTESIDFQVWVGAGDEPLPRRVVITYKDAGDAPQYRAELSNWNLRPDVSPALFHFDLPAGAERLPILVRVSREASGQPAAPGDASQSRKAPDSTGGAR